MSQSGASGFEDMVGGKGRVFERLEKDLFDIEDDAMQDAMSEAMNTTQQLIPSLIPLPPHNSATTTTTNTNDDKEDIFATLFAPSTPRASPTLTPVSDTNVLDPPPTNISHHKHSRTVSTDSDFGAFVSVPATEDPLSLASTEGAPPTSSASTSFSPLGDTAFFDRFIQGAKAATQTKQRVILDELLEHQDDPLYFLSASIPAVVPPEDAASGASTPIPSKSSTSEDQDDDDPFDFLQPTPVSSSSADPAFSYQAPSETSSSSSSILQMTIDAKHSHGGDSPEGPEHPSRTRHPSRRSNRTDSRGPSSSPPLTRSPSLPPTPIRISDPEIQLERAQSFFVPPSLAASSFSTNWVSSLLSRPSSSPATAVTSDLSRRLSLNRNASSEDTVPSSVSTSASQPIANTHKYTRHHPHNGFPTYSGISAPPTLSRVHNRTPTSSSLPIADITHGTPFAPHVYIPPTGAPGFSGDRQWNTGGFEFDKDTVEKKSVKLVGRKEITSAVLTVELADRIRPFFPALARLPQSWSLLYSLDQHGISLNTLYARCTSHQGGALVVLRDSNDALFGAWMGEGIHPSKGSYFGSGESFLWKLTLPEKKLKVFKWTGKNDYIALCESDYISFGGGDGDYGLYLDSTLSDGSSARCITFDNDPLCSAGPRQGDSVTFECVGLEVWGVK